LPGEKAVKDEWDQAAEAWVDFVRTGKDYNRDNLNNPAAFKLIGNVKGKTVLDLACGEGYNTRILARKGAKAIGADFSNRLLRYARQAETREKLGVQYYLLDADELGAFPKNSFDLVTCFMALQDIENHEKAISEVARVLKEKGRFIFSIPHPCFEVMTIKGKRIKAEEDYFKETEYPIQWNMERLNLPFITTSIHRSLTQYFDALYKNHLLVTRLVEPKPTRKVLLRCPPLRDTLAHPQSLIIETVKITDG
jgi:ubiquinone/menaquinone biosynthesis C-methylase UbiE